MKICPAGSIPGIVNGQAKVHKPVEDNCPSFRPILPATDTPAYDLAKFLVPILKPLTENEYTVHDSFSFAKKRLSECPLEFLPNVYKIYVDDIFVTFNSYSQLLKFLII